ncbi:terminase gpA endonuclease subunit [Pseudacidovorax sp. NFM-22]|uniref:terminase gpA endonuclease subunit n=1 Tax=Pseudacidovorax sp. NFM-22 TaxID=2744469 RepID=UPI00351D8608
MEKGDAGPMQLFVNETLGETWELAGERTDEHVLQARAEPYKLQTVPVGCLVLTAGVDVQRNRWEITVWGWGRGLESWVIDVVVIEGNPAVDEEWAAVTAQLQRRYRQDWHGGSLGLSAISIDSSDQTQAVYNWVSKAQHVLPQLRAIKGDGNEAISILGPSSLQEVNWRGRKIARGIKLWRVGTDAAKDLLLGQLAIDQPGPGYVHFSNELPREFFEQLTAEQRVLAKLNGRDAYRWVKRRPRNEQLDNRNYAVHAALGLGLERLSEERWSKLEACAQPPKDLFAYTVPIEVKDAIAPPHLGRSNDATEFNHRDRKDEVFFAPIQL